MLLGLLLLLAGVIIFAGTFLAKFADDLGEHLNLGRSLTGMLLLASATSLPELAVDSFAVQLPVEQSASATHTDSPPDLAVGDIMGSCLFNLLILAVLDLCSQTRGRMFSRVDAAHALSAAVSVFMICIVSLFIIIDVSWPLPRIGPGSFLLLAGYLGCVRLIYVDHKVSQVVITEELMPEIHYTFRTALMGYLAMTAIILATAPALASTADQLAIQTGLGRTFVGTVFVAVATSLPEVSTTYQAVRMGAYDLAIGNIFGSNAFNLLILGVIDVFYSGHLLNDVENKHVITALCVVLMTSAATMGLLYRAEKRYWIIEPDAALILLIGLSALGLVYFL